MTNPELSRPHENIDTAIEHALVRDELIDHYLDQRDTSYDALIGLLERQGGAVAFHDSEQLAGLCAAFPAGTAVEFSEQQAPGDYQSGIIIEDTFLVPLANPSHQPSLYRPHLCATIQDTNGTVDSLLFPVTERSTGNLEVRGLRKLQ